MQADLSVKSIDDIDYEELLKNGKSVFLFDFDNTISVWKSRTIPENVKKIFQYLKSNNAQIFIITNGKQREMNENIGVPIIWRSLKPLTFKVKRNIGRHIKDRDKVVVIGDQIFTDILFGKFLKVYTIKVEPIDTDREFISTRFLRMIEKIFNVKQN